MGEWKRMIGIVVLAFVLIGVFFTFITAPVGKVVHAEAVEKPVREMNQGDAILFAGRVWIVLNPNSGFIFMSEKLTNWPFSLQGHNNFSLTTPDDVGYYLKNRYYGNLTDEEKAVIQEVEWDNGFHGKVLAHVGLLTINEWEKYGRREKVIDPPQDHMWLMTPFEQNFQFVQVVTPFGDTTIRHIWDRHEVHPALYLDPNHVVHKISETAVTFSPNGSGDWAPSYDVVVTASNELEAISELEYAWSTDTMPPTDDWQVFDNGASILTPVGQAGTYYLHVQGMSELNQPFYAVSNPFALDAIQPSSPTITAPTGWTNVATVEITPGVDADSGVKETNYRIGKDSAWGAWTELGEDRNVIIEAEGEISLQAVTVDHAGNMSDVAFAVVNIDGTDPVFSILMTKLMSLDEYVNEEWTNEPVNVIIVAQDQVELSGIESLEIWLDGEQLTDVADASHQIQMDQEGVFHLEMTATDQAGNVATAERTVKISQSGLTLGTTLKKTDDSEYTSGEWTQQSVTASVYADHSQGVPIKQITYSLDQGTTWEDYTVPLTFTEEGRHFLWFNVKDGAGNEMTSQKTIQIDRSAPELTIAMTKQASNLEYFSGGWTNEHVHVSVRAEDQVGLSGMKSLEIWLDGERLMEVEGVSHQILLDQEGIYHLEMAATDEAGNVVTAERTVKISQSGLTLDSTLKQTDGSVYASGDWTRQSVTASVYADHTQGVPIKLIAYSFDEGMTWVDYTNPLTFTEEGRHSLWFNVKDEAGNEMSGQITILIDATAPNIALLPDGNDPGSRQATVSTKIDVTDDCSRASTCSGVNESTLTSIWSMSADPLDEQADWNAFQSGDTLTHSGDDGVWYLHMRAEDYAGNEEYVISKPFYVDDPSQRNAQLSSLLVDKEKIQNFDPETLEYTVQVGHHTNEIAVTPTTEVRRASIKLRMNDGDYVSVGSGEPSPNLELEVGRNTVEILVTALNGLSTKTYTVHVVRAEQESRDNQNRGRYIVPVFSSNAQLEELTISDGALTPEFSQDVLQYTVEVPDETESMIIHPVADHAKAVIMINGEVVEPGKESQSIALKAGTNIIYVNVVAEDGTKLVYEIIVTRGEEPQRLSPDPDESSCLPDKVRFTDLDGHWSENAIREAVCKEIVTGYPDGTFKPDNSITRAEFTVMLAGATSWQSEGSALTFTDHQQISSWAEKAVSQAVEAGVVTGYVDGSFRPDAPINRVEMAVMIAKALDLVVVDGEITAFADDSDVPLWAKGAVEAIRKLGIVSGRGDNHFVPDAHGTRAEAAVMVMRMSIYMEQN